MSCRGKILPTRRTAQSKYAMLAILTFVFLLLSTNSGSVEGALGLFVFGDSYTDTGETLHYPYGITWPGDGSVAHRSSDGRNEVDFLAIKFGVPSPTPWETLTTNGFQSNGGGDFGVGGAGVTYAYGFRSLDQQIDQFESLVNGGTWSGAHLAQSVALVSLAVNDYTYYNQFGSGPAGIDTFVNTVVDKMTTQLQRIQGLGISNILVENLVPMSCMPFSTLYVNGETGCVSNYTLDLETNLHDTRLQAKVNALNNAGGNIVMLDLTKSLRTLFQNGPQFGFSEPYKRCCSNFCGNDGGTYNLCADPSQHVIFDSIHPTQAAWKAVTNLYTTSFGFTKGPTLAQWMQDNQL